MNHHVPEFPFADITQTLPQIIWSARPDGTVDWVNREYDRYTGQDGTDLAAEGWLLVVHPDDRTGALGVWGDARQNGRAYRTEFRIWSSEQNCWRWHLVNASPHRDGSGRITRWYGTAVDIQDIRETQDAYDRELRLQQTERRALEQISRGEGIGRILKDICIALADALPGALPTVALVSRDGGHLEPFHGVDALAGWLRDIARVAVGEGQGACGTSVFRKAPVYSGNIADDPLWTSYRDLAERHQLAACWSVPILGPSGNPIASFACYFRTARTPDGAQIELLHRLAEAVRNAILQVRNRDRLIASEKRYRTLFDFLPVAVWEEDITTALSMLDDLKRSGVVDFAAWLDDNPGFIDNVLSSIRVVDANAAARALHGVESADLQALPEALRRSAGETEFRRSIRNMLIAAWSGTNRISGDSVIRKAGGERTELQIQMLLPEKGSGRLLVTELDVTEQRRADERFRHVAHASSDYIFDRDFNTETTWVSDGASWHADLPAGPSVIPRGTWVESVHPEDADIVRQIEEAISGGATFWEGEYRLRIRSGEFITVRERATIIRDGSGAPVRMIGNIVDLTEQRALEAQLRQAQRLDALGQLTGGIAHDFNNLLTVIMGNAEALTEILPSSQRSATMARQIIDASESAAELTRRLLAFARKQPLAAGDHDATTIIEDMRVLVERSITPAISLELELGSGKAQVHVDRALFESAILNLCLNARDAMPDGGVMRIETALVSGAAEGDEASAPRDHLRVVVRDTGEGMDKKTLDHVFEPFFTTKPPGEGSGLGLSMVYGFVRQSGGRIRIESERGQGTMVELLLPICASPPGDAAATDASAGVQGRFKGRILVVEDHDQVRDYTCMLVRSLGFEVVENDRATTALERLNAGERIDLVLSDVVMPGGMSGHQLAARIVETRPGLPVLLVSGHAEDVPTLDQPFGAQVGFMRKPFRKRELAARLAEMLPKP